jgi:hypothetical protein
VNAEFGHGSLLLWRAGQQQEAGLCHHDERRRAESTRQANFSGGA